jgi:hypothetical protein
MAPDSSYCSWNKHCYLTPNKRDSNNKEPHFVLVQTMCLILNQSTWRPTGDSIMNQRTSYPKPCESILNWSLHNDQHVGLKITHIESPTAESRPCRRFELTLHDTQNFKVMIFLRVNHSTSFWKKDVSKKSNIDTTIDFVKLPIVRELTFLLNTVYSKKNNLE